MRIAQVCPYSLSEPGGVQEQVLGLSRALAGMGHELTVIGPLDGEGPGESCIPFEVVGTGPTVSVEANGSLAPIAIDRKTVSRALAALRAQRFDILHLHEPLVPGPTMAALIACRVPMVGTFHLSGGSASYTYLRPFVRTWVKRLTVRCCVSEEARATVEKYLGGNYTVLYNGVDVERFRAGAGAECGETGYGAGAGRAARNDPPVVAFLGRHEARKGLGTLIDAVARLRDGEHGPRCASAVLRIAGEGPDTIALRERAVSLPGVEWLGRLDGDAVVKHVAGAEVLCAPSSGGESFGVVLVEAMAAGTPVVAGDIPGYRQVATGGSALLVPPGDPVALSAALARVLTEPELTDSMREAGRRRADAFSMGSLAGHYADIYASLA